MKISFCLFTFNQAAFVVEALHSAFAQDHPSLQIVVIDDGSTDETQQLIRAEVAAYRGPHEITLHLKDRNRGLADSVNTVLYELATGDWLVFAAGDDVSVPTRCSTLAARVAANPAATTVQVGASLVDVQRKPLSYRPPRPNTLADLHRLTVCGASAAYRRDAVTAFAPMGEGVMNEDFVLTGRALLLGVQIEMDQPQVEWRQHGQNLTAQLSHRGRHLRRANAALLQQVSDVAAAATLGRVDAAQAEQAIALLMRRVARNAARADFNEASTSFSRLLAYALRHPLSVLRELAAGAYLWLRSAGRS